MVNVFQSLLLVIAGATEKELARQVKYLKVENEVLRAKLPKRITIAPKERRLVRFTHEALVRCSATHPKCGTCVNGVSLAASLI
jgi:hypothetical protein